MKIRINIPDSRLIFNKQLLVTFLAVIGFSLSVSLFTSDVHHLTLEEKEKQEMVSEDSDENTGPSKELSPESGKKSNPDWNKNPKILVWILVVSILTAFSFAIVLTTIQKLSKLTNTYKISLFSKISYAFFTLALIISPILFQISFGTGVNIADVVEEKGVLFHNPRLVFSGSIIFFSLFVCLCLAGVFLVNYALEKTFDRDYFDQNKENSGLLIRCLSLRKELDYYFLTIMVYLTFLIFFLAINRQMIVVALSEKEAFSQDFVYLLSFYYSFFAAIIYLPVYFNFKQKINRQISKMNPNPLNKSSRDSEKSLAERLINWKEIQEKLEETYSVNSSLRELLQVGIRILSPIIVGYLTNFFTGG